MAGVGSRRCIGGMKGFLYVIGAIGTQSLLSCVLEAIVNVKFGSPRAAGPLSEDITCRAAKLLEANGEECAL